MISRRSIRLTPPDLRLWRPCVALASLLLVSGCYFSSGRTIEPTAYLRKGNSPGSTESIEIRGTTWTTGNSHVPFDFTVYEQDSTFEIRVPSLVGETQAKDMQLWTCGVRLETFSGIVRPVADGVLVNLEVPDPSGLEKDGEDSPSIPASCYR